jgi:hypothetical protein
MIYITWYKTNNNNNNNNKKHNLYYLRYTILDLSLLIMVISKILIIMIKKVFLKIQINI